MCVYICVGVLVHILVHQICAHTHCLINRPIQSLDINRKTSRNNNEHAQAAYVMENAINLF